MFGAPLEVCQKSVGTAVADTLEASGIELSAFLFGAAELGRTGEVIQATLRARHELQREQAEAPTRLARATNDADLQQNLTLSNEDAWRYRETDLWGELSSARRPCRSRRVPQALEWSASRPPIGLSLVPTEPAPKRNRERENRRR